MCEENDKPFEQIELLLMDDSTEQSYITLDGMVLTTAGIFDTVNGAGTPALSGHTQAQIHNTLKRLALILRQHAKGYEDRRQDDGRQEHT